MNESFIVYNDSAILKQTVWFSRNSCLDWNAYFTYIFQGQVQSNFDGSNSSGPSVRVRPNHVFEQYLAW